jgi:hypothetical protein
VLYTLTHLLQFSAPANRFSSSFAATASLSLCGYHPRFSLFNLALEFPRAMPTLIQLRVHSSDVVLQAQDLRTRNL